MASIWVTLSLRNKRLDVRLQTYLRLIRTKPKEAEKILIKFTTLRSSRKLDSFVEKNPINFFNDTPKIQILFKSKTVVIKVALMVIILLLSID